MKKTIVVLLLGAFVGCGVSEKEAKETLQGIESIAAAPADVRVVLLGSLCVESEACARDCREVLKALGSVAPQDRMLLVSQCDTSVKPLPETDGQKAFAEWMAKRIGLYVKGVREALPEAERARLDQAWNGIKAN